jgi:hypothetical protein
MSKDTLRIEIVFPFKVDVPERASRLIHEAVSLICEKNCPENSVMWPSGHGQKPTYIPMTQYEEQFRGMEFDDTVEYFEVSCRTAYPKEIDRKALAKAESANPSTNTGMDKIMPCLNKVCRCFCESPEIVLNCKCYKENDIPNCDYYIEKLRHT